MIGFTLRLPEEVHQKLIEYKNTKKSHISLNALIVEAIVESIKAQDPKR